MHILVPSFILHKAANNENNGRFPATGLFVDISGFTQVTEALLQHGQHGAEVLATVMRAVFDPLIDAVYTQGGFVSNFAGDAFTAIFSADSANEAMVALHALSAATAIQTTMQKNAMQTTPYGDFTFSAKVGLAGDTAVWGIIHSPDETCAAYYFRGSAVTGCADAESDAAAGDIVVDTAVYQAAKKVGATAVPINTHWRITNFTTDLPPATLQSATLPPYNLDLATRFFPRPLFQQAINGEFRHIHYLFISLKGQPDHAAITEFVRVLFELQQTYGGLLNRIDFGDKGCHMLLFWGAPVSHESDLARILNLILELRKRSAIPLRAGITYRIAHAGFVGSALAEEYTCYGRGVNLAARHMMAADWGEIWLDGEMARRAEQQFDLSFIGERAFKGFAEPQPVYLLNGRRENVTKTPYSGVLVGRKSELDQLHNWLAPWRNGRNPGAMRLSGEAGIGKSRLVYELLNEVQTTNPCQFFVCPTNEILRQSLNPFRYFLRDYFQQSAQQNADMNRETFDRILQEQIAATKVAALQADLARGRSFLAHLVDLHWENSLFAQLEPQLRFENTLYALRTFFLAASLQRPVILHLEDTHWLDEDSRQFLSILTHEIDAYPLALLATGRTAVTKELFAPQFPQQEIHLRALGTDAIDALAHNLLGHAPGDNLARFLATRTDGNPFFVEQMLLYLQKEGLIEQIEADQQAQFADTLPTDARALLVARLDRLTPEVRAVAQQASVLGREFEINILQAVTDTTLDLSKQLHTGTEDAIWFPLSDERYIFKHALLRDAAYKMQVRSRRRILHEKTAVAYETVYKPELSSRLGQIAYHYDQAVKKDKALEYYAQAGDYARNGYQNEESLAHYGRALELVPETAVDMRYQLYFGQESVHQWLGQREAQKKDLVALLSLLNVQPNDSREAEIRLRQSALAFVTGYYADAQITAKLSIIAAQRAGDKVIESHAYHRLGRILWKEGQNQEAEVNLTHALKLARVVGDKKAEVQSHYDSGIIAYYASDFIQAKAILNRALSIYEEIDDKQGQISCLNLLGLIAFKFGHYAAAQADFDRCLALCRELGWRFGEVHVLAHIGDNYFALADYESSQKYHQRARILSRQINDVEGETVSLDTLGLIAHKLGQYSEAHEYFAQGIKLTEVTENRHSRGYLLTHLGFTLIQLNALELAEAALKKAQTIRLALDDATLLDTLAGLAAVALDANQKSSALVYVDEILDWIHHKSIDGIEFPLQVYLICFYVLHMNADNDQVLSRRAKTVLDDSYALLQKLADEIKDTHMRQQFLSDDPVNAALTATWRKHNTHDYQLA